VTLRIGICAPYDLARDGGVNSHIRAQALALRRLGHSVRVFGSASAPLPDGERAMSGCISPVIGGTETGIGIDVRAWRRVRRLFAAEQFDVVHVHEPLMPLVPWCALLQARAPIVATFHTHRERHRFYSSYGRLLAPLMRRVAVRIAVSAAAKRTVERHFPGDYLVIPNGIDTSRFLMPTDRPSSMPSSRRHVLFVGRLEPRKGVEHLIDAMASVQRDAPPVRLVIVGDGPSRAALEARVREASVDACFVGRLPDDQLAAHYRAADVVCSPATGDESFGIVLLEAMAAGRPVVATDIPGYRELVADGAARGVRLVAAASPLALAAELTSLLRDGALRERLGAAGPAFAERFHWDAIARILDARYFALVRAGAAADSS
jgi:phosphatidylinositol alpha-mannosyltransferase